MCDAAAASVQVVVSDASQAAQHLHANVCCCRSVAVKQELHASRAVTAAVIP
jgi:hypothetical protein